MEFLALEGFPQVKQGDDLASLIVGVASSSGVEIEEGDIIVVTTKVVSKAEGRVVPRESVAPGRKARKIARLTGKDPVEVELILRESAGILGEIPLARAHRRFARGLLGGESAGAVEALKKTPSLLLVRMPDGCLATDAGIDGSNVPEGLCLLPRDPHASAEGIRRDIERMTGRRVAVLLADTEIRLMRQGTTDVAVGVAGMDPVRRGFGSPDMFGRPKAGGIDGVADLVTGAAAILMGQTKEAMPVVIAKGVDYADAEEGAGAGMPVSWLGWGVAWGLWSWLKFRLACLLPF